MPVNIINRQNQPIKPELQQRWQKVPVAIAVDINPAACQIDPAIRPLCPPGNQPRLFGRALTVQCEPPDFGAVLYAANMVSPGDVLVISASGVTDTAMIGEIISGHVRQRGGVGVICDGAVRDVGELANWSDFSVFSRFITPKGPLSAKKGAVNVPVQFGGQEISPGDVILGDDDGLARLTPEMMKELIQAAETKLNLEMEWLERLGNGESVEDVFDLDKTV